MSTLETDQAAIPHVESVLREELARGDKALSRVAPVLTHMLANPDHSLISDAILARLRGMLGAIAQQVLNAAHGGDGTRRLEADQVDRFSDYLAADSAVLSHLYAIAMEAEFTERLVSRLSIDPVLSPLLQELIASHQPATAELAMNAMAAQSRFVQSQRRMEHSIGELPAELFDLVVRRSVAYVRELGASGAPTAVQTLRRSYDESATRVVLLNRLVTGMGNAARAALAIDHAGIALFASALGVLSHQPRELAVLACHDRQAARLALGLRASGLDASDIERQFGLLEPDERLPAGLDDIAPSRAQSILNRSPSPGVG